VGLPPAAVRRAWAAVRHGSWQIADLLAAWNAYVHQQGLWQPSRYGGYVPLAVDLTAYWRSTLRGWLSKHFHSLAGKARPAVVLGMIARVGRVSGQRVALLTQLIRSDPQEPSETALHTAVLDRVANTLANDEMPVFDAGFKIAQLQAAYLPRYLVRLAKNFTARRNVLPESTGRGRPLEYGERVRPLSRRWKERRLPATPPPPCRPPPPASGIGGRCPLPGGCAVCWRAPLFPKVTPGPHHFGKRPRCATTYPRAFRCIGARKRPSTPEYTLQGSVSKAFSGIAHHGGAQGGRTISRLLSTRLQLAETKEKTEKRKNRHFSS